MRTPLAFFAVLCSSCAFLSAPTPMTFRPDPFGGGGAVGVKPKCLIVFLPGAGDNGRAYYEHGFVKKVRDHQLSADVVSSDATFRYYFKGTFLERFEKDVLAPYLAKNYEHVWLIGISMGGFGSLFYPSQRPGQIDGVLALAPWLGDDELTRKIHEAGGLKAWQAPEKAPVNEDNYQQQLWRWLKAVNLENEPGPKIWLGWGTKDQAMAGSDEMLGAVMQKDHLFSAEGGHEWKPWTEMFEKFLTVSEIATQCAQ
jgi:pimeloyl-ACP methyl ester carboxylesterase